jgi:NhaA family Na+:H+ antiporter
VSTAPGDRPQGDRLLVLRPLRDFLRTEAAGGVAVLAAAVVALVWANSPWSDSYTDLWSTRIVIDVGGHVLDLDLQGWINDGLMAIFFFVVGLEIKRELVDGELRDPRRAALPAIAAVGGMVAPALIYAAFNAGGDGAGGWGIPVATDIALAVGVISVLGSAVEPALKLFLLALAIVDDIGAIAIIAIFYSHGFDGGAALVAVALLGAVVGCRAMGVRSIGVYVVLGVGVWLAIQESGIHATIAGVALAFLTPTQPLQRRDMIDADELLDLSTVESARQTAALARSSVSVVEWLEHRLHPWTSFVIVPLFALANAGVPISVDALSAAWSSSITHGIVLGLVVGKLVGVTAATWVAVRLGIGTLPPGVTWRGIIGVGALAGIGFTVSVFITELAFDDQILRDNAKIAILVASVLAGALGTLIMRLVVARGGSRDPAMFEP